MIIKRDERYVAFKRATGRLMSHFFLYAIEELLDNGKGVLMVKGGDKDALRWLYLYMAAGKQKPQEHPKRENLTLSQSVEIY